MGSGYLPSIHKKNSLLNRRKTHKGAALLASLAEMTGGTIANLDVDSSSASRERLKTVLQRLYQVMADFYEVKIEVPPNAIRRELSWELRAR